MRRAGSMSQALQYVFDALLWSRTQCTMKRATCVGHSTMPRAQTRWLGAPFEAPRLANQAAVNVTCFRRRSKRWGTNPTKNPTQTISTHTPTTTSSRHLLSTAALCQETGSAACTTSPTTRRRRPALAPSAPSRLQRARSETKTIVGRQNCKAFDMLPWQMHHDAPRRHQICQYPYTCTALMLANCLMQRRRLCQRRQLLLLCTLLPIPALFARDCQASFVCIDLSPRLLAYGLLVRSARWVYTGAPAHVDTCVPVL